jgi:hypothetical protein
MMKLTCGVIAAACIAWAMPARADDAAHDRAVAAFQEGRKYIDANNCDAAITKLRESLSFEASVGARLSLADCYERTDLLAAWRMLRDAASLAYINHDERLTLAETRATALERRLPTIHVVMPPSVLEQPGFELRVDGELIDKFHYRNGVIATKPGKHVIEASAPLRHWSERITSDAAGTTQVTVQLERDTCVTAASPPTAQHGTPAAVPRESSSPGSARRTLGLALAGVGIAGLASGVVFGLLTLEKKSTIEELCGGNPGSCNAPAGSVDPERESAKTTATISTASFIVGGLALVGGGVLYFTAPSAVGTTGRVRLAPQIADGGGSLGLAGSW